MVRGEAAETTNNDEDEAIERTGAASRFPVAATHSDVV